MISDDQMPQHLRDLVAQQTELFRKQSGITVYREIPDTAQIPISNPLHWLRIPDIVCVFVDMKGSTQLSASTHDRGTAGVYQLFTGTAVRLFAEFQSPYIDVRGDGVFALFNYNQVYRALAAAVSFKTFARDLFAPLVKEKTGLGVGAHIGIDQKTVLVRKIGLKRYSDRTDRQNEVWAGKPVNMASKLAAMGDADQLLVSDRYYARIDHRLVQRSCGCPSGTPVDLWQPVDVSSDPKFDFDAAYLLKSIWCKAHGKTFLEEILMLD